MNAVDMEAIAARHPDLVHTPLSQRLALPIGVTVVVLYLAFCWWFFSIGKVLGSASWDIAGAYLADWVSYEERPDIKIAPDGMTVTFPNNSALGDDPQPEWLKKEEKTVTRVVEKQAPAQPATTTESKSSSFNFLGTPDTKTEDSATSQAETPQTITERVVSHAVIDFSSSTSIDVTPERATIHHDGETLVVPLGGSEIRLHQPLPSWASQPHAGG